MFSKSKPSPEAAPVAATQGRNSMRGGGHTFSVIASDVEITGNLSAKVDLHIDGKINGDVTCGSLVQGEGSVISGKVVAETARLSGKVDGSIEAGDLVIEASARISGDVVYQSLTIAPGGMVEGKFKHRGSHVPNIGKATIDISKTDPLILGAETKVG
ncbi:polymer-forming cytoskeletal protein [Sphingorhabdus sp.]|jgi:cytoskeletal protein CcmA (bactofilin family)|uniref:bactofilin family protein n=1 Tax=Sphingorhabdus sp. TaxID=1902408 RepID=UPI0011D688F4|nr:polymer-forming cytoskeletal protein [Sphingorhabdus sp.]TXH12461.1 MAG: polymer-forming cytoskeletal protein [Gammaproteobacteria bacterium]HMT40259.1 polymer-forming cytoskeletal protein [Sphingorhabdus sp.]